MNFKKKILYTSLLFGLTPMIVVVIFSLSLSYTSFNAKVEEELKLIVTEKKLNIEQYYATITKQVATYSNNIMIQNAMSAFAKDYKDLESFESINDVNQSLLKARYDYQLKNTENATAADLKKWLPQAPVARYLQSKYIAENKHGIGDKQNLNIHNDGTAYAKTHEKFHETIRHYLEEFGYYDIFLVEPQNGNIVYSVFKEVDYGTSLFSGPYKNTLFADVAKKALKLKNNNEFILSGFAPYAPSYNGQASFIASPIIQDGQTLGVLVFQMPIDGINLKTQIHGNLASTFTTYTISSDGVIKSDIVGSEKSTIGLKLDTDLLKEAIGQPTLTGKSVDYLGNSVTTKIVKLDIPNQDWYYVAEINNDKLTTDLINKSFLYIIIGFLATIAIYFGSRKLANDAIKPLLEISESFRVGSKEINKVSRHVEEASSVILSQANTTNEKGLGIKTEMGNVSNLVQAIASAIEEMNASIIQISDNAGTSREKINGVSQNVQQTATEIQSLVIASEEISKVTSIIQDLSDQTNLLALNASIEAARAGEAGRGFAVVADEVKKLAERTNSAVQEIEGKVTQIKQASTTSSNSMDRVTSGVEDIASQIEYVSTSVSEQNQATNDITTSVDDMVNMIESTEKEAIAIEETSLSSLELSEKLKEETAQLGTTFSSLEEKLEGILKRLGIS